MPTVYEKLVLTDYKNLPRAVRDAFIAHPAAELSVEAEGGGFALVSHELPWEVAPIALVPKLGIKTWRDSGRLHVLHKGIAVRPKLEALLRTPTHQQCLALQAYEEMHTTPSLYLVPYVDFTHVSEARLLCSRGNAQFTSACLRGDSASLYDNAKGSLRDFAISLARFVELDRCVVDLALTPEGRVMLVEVNPALMPHEIDTLSQRLRARGAA